MISTATWQRWGPLLTPASWGFRAVVAARRASYATGLVKRQRVAAPVVSVGNLTVGGTGKTPAALWLAAALQAEGRKPAIVSRGYGGRLGRRVAIVGRGAGALLAPDEVGDEAVLLAERFAAPVVCATDRVAAAQTAIAELGADVVVLDDGFQHWRLHRDADVVLVDVASGCGNGRLLPAGPLREPPSAIARADALILTKARAGEPAVAPAEIAAVLGAGAATLPTLAATLVPLGLVSGPEASAEIRPLADLAGSRVVTVCAIARPAPFYELLGQLDARAVEVLEYADHHPFDQGDWQRITQAAHRADLVVCTEKDLVKLRRFPFARGRLVALRVGLEFASGDGERLLAVVRAALARREGRGSSDEADTDPSRAHGTGAAPVRSPDAPAAATALRSMD